MRSRTMDELRRAPRSRDRDGIGRSPMSFYVEFTAASHDDALKIVLAEEFLPDSVRTFICQARGVSRRPRHLRQGGRASLQQGLRGQQRGDCRARNQASISKVGTFAARTRGSRSRGKTGSRAVYRAARSAFRRPAWRPSCQRREAHHDTCADDRVIHEILEKRRLQHQRSVVSEADDGDEERAGGKVAVAEQRRPHEGLARGEGIDEEQVKRRGADELHEQP
jgi:hypothetical protein